MEDKILNKIKETLIPKKQVITAEGAYTLSKYGQKLTEEELYRRSIEDIGNLIIAKSQNGGSSILYEFDNTFPKMKENVSKHFSDLGFLILVIDSKMHAYIKYPKLLISWER